jgi:hypothetical protein
VGKPLLPFCSLFRYLKKTVFPTIYLVPFSVMVLAVTSLYNVTEIKTFNFNLILILAFLKIYIFPEQLLCPEFVLAFFVLTEIFREPGIE